MPESGSRCSGDKRVAAVEVQSSVRVAGRELVAAARWDAYGLRRIGEDQTPKV
jgi:hypothetical protein